MSVCYEEFAKVNAKPLIVFLKHYESHPFDDRMILASGEVKIGRAVARLKSATNNAIFDCKVLSRNHAIITYTDRKFILKDTKSSNGTYVNNSRVTKDDSEYGEREIFSNDIVKFGVEVLEHGQTHGCIVTQVKLFHPNGQEARQKSVESKQTSAVSVRLSNENFFRLENYVMDAIYRENNIREKTAELGGIMEEIAQATSFAWKAMLNEERLLDKIRLYEKELRIYKENLPEDSYKIKYIELEEKLAALEDANKNMTRTFLEEKESLSVALSEAERKSLEAHAYAKKVEADMKTFKDSYKDLLSRFDNKAKDLDKMSDDLHEESSKRQEAERLLTDSQNALAVHQNGVKKEEGEASGDILGDIPNLPVFKSIEGMNGTHPSPVSPFQPQIPSSNPFQVTKTEEVCSSVEEVKVSANNNASNGNSHKDLVEELSFQDEYRSLQSKLEMIEREMNTCKSEQLSVKEENKLLKAQLSNLEVELGSSREKVSRMQMEMMQPSTTTPVDLPSSTTASTPQSSEPVNLPNGTCKTCACHSQQDKMDVAYNYALVPVMVLLLALMYSIFSFFNPR